MTRATCEQRTANIIDEMKLLFIKDLKDYHGHIRKPAECEMFGVSSERRRLDNDMLSDGSLAKSLLM